MTPKLMIFTPTYADLMEGRFVESVEAQEFNGDVRWEISDRTWYPGRDMRNVCKQYEFGRQLFLDSDCDAVLFAEHDMILPPGCIQTLYDTPAPVVYSAYMLRHGTEVISLFRKEGRRNIGQSLSLYPAELKRFREQGWGEVSGVGFGCTLIRRPVFEQVEITISENAPDIPFSRSCLTAGILQIGRMDVACKHINSEGYALTIDMDGGRYAKVVASADVTVNLNGESVRLQYGDELSIELKHARELQRAGCVRITGMEPIEGRETAEMPDFREMAIPDVVKRKPKGR